MERTLTIGAVLLAALCVAAKPASSIISALGFLATSGGTEAQPAFATPNWKIWEDTDATDPGSVLYLTGPHGIHNFDFYAVTPAGGDTGLDINSPDNGAQWIELDCAGTASGYPCYVWGAGPFPFVIRGSSGITFSPTSDENYVPWKMDTSGNLTGDNLAGSGNAQVCVDSTGKLYRGSPGC